MSCDIDKLCNSCFRKRSKKASDSYSENLFISNFSLFLIPIINSFIMAKIAAEKLLYPDGYAYHLYINGIHEKWSKNKIDDNKLMKKCDECKKYHHIYFHLESDD